MREFMRIITEGLHDELFVKHGSEPTLDHPAIMYHMTMPNTREQIEQEGLRRDRGETFEMGGAGAVFFYTKPQPFGKEDVWQIDVTGIPLGLDETTDPYDDEDSWWCTYDHDIPRERMKLIHRAPSKVEENELTEVKMIDDFGDEGMERVFNRWTAQGADGEVVGNINGYDIHEKDGGLGRTFLFLFKDGECAGRATVDIARGMENTVKMAHIVIHPDLRRKGLGIGLYEYVLQSNDIVSDYDQTRFGRAIWQELARRHVVRPLEIDDSLSAPITNTDQVYGTHTRLVASRV